MLNQHHIHPHQRDISSSEDNCRCEACKNQEQIKNYQRTNPTHIYMFKHSKKRGGPPTKKEIINKDYSQKAKCAPKKQELEKKVETQKPSATPVKHRLIEALKSKQIQNPSFFIDYHPVSHSQREKVPSKQAMSNMIEQPRRLIAHDDLKNNGVYKEHRSRIVSTKLVQISQNPENIKLRYNHSRSMSQASANYQDQTKVDEIVKSLEKLKF